MPDKRSGKRPDREAESPPGFNKRLTAKNPPPAGVRKLYQRLRNPVNETQAATPCRKYRQDTAATGGGRQGLALFHASLSWLANARAGFTEAYPPFLFSLSLPGSARNMENGAGFPAILSLPVFPPCPGTPLSGRQHARNNRPCLIARSAREPENALSGRLHGRPGFRTANRPARACCPLPKQDRKARRSPAAYSLVAERHNCRPARYLFTIRPIRQMNRANGREKGAGDRPAECAACQGGKTHASKEGEGRSGQQTAPRLFPAPCSGLPLCQNPHGVRPYRVRQARRWIPHRFRTDRPRQKRDKTPGRVRHPEALPEKRAQAAFSQTSPCLPSYTPAEGGGTIRA